MAIYKIMLLPILAYFYQQNSIIICKNSIKLAKYKPFQAIKKAIYMQYNINIWSEPEVFSQMYDNCVIDFQWPTIQNHNVPREQVTKKVPVGLVHF